MQMIFSNNFSRFEYEYTYILLKRIINMYMNLTENKKS